MKKVNVNQMVSVALLMAIVVVLQLLGQFIKFGPVSISLVLVPIVVGAAMCGPVAGAILGATFSVVVLLQPDTVFFYGISVFGTVATVLVKGILAGFLAGQVFRAVEGMNKILAVILSAAVCPVVNTGIFLIGCRLFFWDAMNELGGGNAVKFVITVMVGFNFLAEFAANLICSHLIVRIINAVKHH